MEKTEVDAHLARWGREWGVEDLAERAAFSFAPRIRRSLGRCYPAKGVIALNPSLAEKGNEAVALEVLCHEAAHLAASVLHGMRVKPHGAEWRALMTAAGYRGRARFPSGEVAGMVTKPRARKYEYLHSCRDCSATFRSRTTNRRWRCKSCHTAGRGGRLSVVRLALRA